MFGKATVRGLVAAALVASAVAAQADVFNMPSGQTSLQFVSVGNPNNPPDPATGSLYGSVGYMFQMGKYDVTVGQYCQFLNSVAKADPYGLYSYGMASDLPTIHLTQGGSSGSYSYAVTGSDSQAANCPIVDVSFGDAARFCNWLQNGQPTAPEGNGTTETGVYTLNGATLMAVTRNANATYFIPSENEFYKAAYYDPMLNGGAGGYWTYPTKSNIAPNNSLDLSATSTNDANYDDGSYTDSTNYLTPVGTFLDSPGPYGTYDMGGDVSQWNEATIQVVVPERGLRGGSWDYNFSTLASSLRYGYPPTVEINDVGFRVASVPEPTSLALLLAGGFCLLAYAWRRRRQAAWAKA